MGITVRIPTPLRKYTDGQDQVGVDGTTVGEALAELSQDYPDLKSRVFDDDGDIRRFVNVFANDEDIRFQQSLDTDVSDGDQISIVPAIAGG